MNFIVYCGHEDILMKKSPMRPTTYIKPIDGNGQPAINVLQFPVESRQPTQLEGLITAGLVIGGIIVIADVLGQALNSLFQTYNRKPLTATDRAYIRERDDEMCYYCGTWAPNGHVDHMTSRLNGGSNAIWNLAWACITCNCTKGSLNCDEFLAAYEL